MVTKHIRCLVLAGSLLCSYLVMAQQENNTAYKKRVLENTEVDILSSYYEQTGNNASVTGGIGNERLTDIAPSIVVSIPLNADDILTIDAGISTYTSASSSNLDPFDLTGASGGYEDDDDDGPSGGSASRNPQDVIGSPWLASSGASRQDTWGSIAASYAHNSEDRNTITNLNASFATEYDYVSIGFGAGLTKLFNQKNTEVGVKANVFLDSWIPKYPSELDTYVEVNGDTNAGFFQGLPILDEQGNVTNKNSTNTWRPLEGFGLIENEKRNTYALSLSFSQIVSKNAQLSLFADVIQQQGWLANPMQRVYFADRSNYYVGNAASIPNYTSPENVDVFQLADDLERLPSSRLKIPIGMRFNYYINEIVSLRSYYRYYFDDWGLTSHTAQLEMPIKVSPKFTVYPSYRYYQQSAMDYFAPFETHLSTNEFYTSDFDLSAYNAGQLGIGLSYTDIFTKFKTWKFGLKSIDFKYNNYSRNTGLKASYFGIGMKFVMD